MAAPTPNTRMIAHTAVGIAGGIVAKKTLGTGGVLIFLAGLTLVIMLHEALDAPVARAMATAGLQL